MNAKPAFGCSCATCAHVYSVLLTVGVLRFCPPTEGGREAGRERGEGGIEQRKGIEQRRKEVRQGRSAQDEDRPGAGIRQHESPHRPHRPHRAKRSGPRKSGVPSPGWARRTPLTAPSLHPRRPLCPAPCSRMRPEVRRRPTGQCRSGRCSSRCSAGYSPCAGLARLRSWTSSPRRSASWSGGDGPLA